MSIFDLVVKNLKSVLTVKLVANIFQQKEKGKKKDDVVGRRRRLRLQGFEEGGFIFVQSCQLKAALNLTKENVFIDNEYTGQQWD